MRDEIARPTLRPSAGSLRTELPQLDRIRRLLLRALMLTFGRLVEVEGAERLAGLAEPAIFALNHSNAAESILVPATLIYRPSRLETERLVGRQRGSEKS